MIRVKSRQDNFRRAGVVHMKEAKDYADDFFTPEQLATLKADPMLTVTEMPGEGEIKKEKAHAVPGEVKGDLFDHITNLKERVSRLESNGDVQAQDMKIINDTISTLIDKIESLAAPKDRKEERKPKDKKG
jgi:hypothetical protein